MAGLDVKTVALTGRNLPTRAVDGLEVSRERGGVYGEDYVLSLFPTKHLLADEGSYFVSTNPTPGTAIQLSANVTAFADTNALFVIGNKESPNNALAKRIYLDYIKLLVLGTAPTATQSMEFAIKRDNVSREPTTAANRTILTPANCAKGAGRESIARMLSYANAGAMTIPAASLASEILHRGRIPTGLGITGDEYILKFGGEDMGAVPGMTAVRASGPARLIGVAAPIIIEPGEWLAIHMWWLTAATTAASFEFEIGHVER